MSKVTYNGKTITPSPIITSMSRDYFSNGARELIGHEYNITMTGTIVSKVGFDDLMAQKLDISEIFDCPGQILEISCDDIVLSTFCVQEIINLTFSETPDNWSTSVNWSISLNATEITSFASCAEITSNLSSVSNAWDMQEELQNPTSGGSFYGSGENCPVEHYNVSHTITATAMPICDTGADPLEAWQIAKSYCESQAGFDTGVFYENSCWDYGFTLFNQTRVHTTDKSQGNYSIQESWLVKPNMQDGQPDSNVTETLEVSVSKDAGVRNSGVSISGQIIGLDSRLYESDGCRDLDGPGTRIENAEEYWETRKTKLHTTAELVSGLVLSPKPISTRVSVSPCSGLINFDFQYSENTFCLTAPTGYDLVQEEIDVSVEHPTDVYSEVYVIGRPCPIIRDMGIRTKASKTISVSLVADPTGEGEAYCDPEFYCGAPFKEAVDQLISPCYGELTGEYDVVVTDSDQESWSPTTGSYTRTVSWSYAECCEPSFSSYSIGGSNSFEITDGSYRASFFEEITITGADSGDEIILPRSRNDIGKRVNITNLSDAELDISLSIYDSFAPGSLTSIETGEYALATVVSSNTWKVL